MRSLNEIIQKCSEIHEHKYDYSQIIYKNLLTPVKIICKKHGEFFQRLKNHLLKQDCPKCSKNRLSKDEFIERVRKIHRYDL